MMDQLTTHLKARLLALQEEKQRLKGEGEGEGEGDVAFFFWATVTNGFEDDAAREVNETLQLWGPTGWDQKRIGARGGAQGNITFCVRCPPSRVGVLVATLKMLTYLEYLFVALASGFISANGLQYIGKLVADIPSANLAAALLLWGVWNPPAAGQPPYASRGAPLSFRVKAKRGGQHNFSSDEAKRAVAMALTSHHGLPGSLKCPDMQVQVQVHNRSVWVGISLNGATLFAPGRHPVFAAEGDGGGVHQGAPKEKGGRAGASGAFSKGSKGAGGGASDWTCPGCAASCFGSKLSCFKCHTARSGAGGGGEKLARPEKAKLAAGYHPAQEVELDQWLPHRLAALRAEGGTLGGGLHA